MGARRQFRAQENYYVVPFQIEHQECTVYRGWRFMFVSRVSNRNVVRISTFRGVVNLESLVKEALHWFNAEFSASRQVASHSRYYIVEVIGSEKNAGALASAMSNGVRSLSEQAI